VISRARGAVRAEHAPAVRAGARARAPAARSRDRLAFGLEDRLLDEDLVQRRERGGVGDRQPRRRTVPPGWPINAMIALS